MHYQPVAEMVDNAYIGRPQEEVQVEPQASNDALDDVFGSGPSSPTAEHHHDESVSHPSDINRLQTEHTTAGYREGITVSKEKSLQEGFDEGFSLGATVGLKAGQLLGVLEGIADAARTPETTTLLNQAREDLSVKGIFKADYWAEDGNWKYEVKAEGDDVVFADVADAHPLIKKWTAVLDEQVALWRIDRGVLDDETGERLEGVLDEPLVSAGAPATKKPLDW
ncbi:hypothetical protein CEP54_003937 [Fusarium duplospermum]|uniref:Protein YAE1 n=1 Tax=Fusarium duplospermum TaxID=1325734 RepID=A0A428QLB7_9HYPO|nr:hypothetical protein CEP54_003937 [Fusarium duplospermum]